MEDGQNPIQGRQLVRAVCGKAEKHGCGFAITARSKASARESLMAHHKYFELKQADLARGGDL